MRQVFEALVVGAIVALSLRRGVFLFAALRRPRPLPRPGAFPSVSVLVPARNECSVARRLLGALARITYPPDKLSFVLICDGCTDETPAVFQAWAGQRSDARVLELPRREGKGAALNAGLRVGESEIVAVADADLELHPGFLAELVRPFTDPRVGAAAAFLRPSNADDNVVSRYAAVTTWVHQLVTSAGTDRLGLNPPTLGAAAFRRTALEQIGGFPDVPLGEDVATSARLIRRGWRTRFVPSAIADNTVVSGARAYWLQHVRWARAVFRVFATDRRRSAAPWLQRLELGASSFGYGDRLVFAIAALGAIVGALPIWAASLSLVVPGVEVVAALLKAGVGRRLPRFLAATVLFFAADLAGSVAAAIVHAVRRPDRWDNPRWLTADGDAHR
jgi:cellulose synthase/poly-beta-1,6-N-acetylglucosamine synthase-like glycosyltransferase